MVLGSGSHLYPRVSDTLGETFTQTLSDALKERAYEVSANVAPPLPGALHEGIPLFRASEFAREYVGSEFVDRFADSRDWELDQFQRSITDWEVRRYLDEV